MTHRLASLAPRLALLVLLGVLATSATLTFAAVNGSAPIPAARPSKKAAPATLVVPRVTGQAYVFAKGILEDNGFAWQVKGAVKGYAANTVTSQTPAPGTRVVDNGYPTLVLRLTRNTRYPQRGVPEAASTYRGHAVQLPGARVAASKGAARAFSGGKIEQSKPAPKKQAAHPKQQAAAKKQAAVKKQAAAKKAVTAGHDRYGDWPAKRTAAFSAPGAPKEPLDEMPLTHRALMLRDWVAGKPDKTDANVQHWIYQHAWVVEGAKFGWWHGSEALRTLIGVDRQVEQLWGFGAKSEAQARAALAEVAARAS